MFFDIHQLEQGKVRFEETLPPGAIEFFDQQLRQSGPVKAAGTAEMDAMMEIRVAGHVRAPLEASCDRCLEPAPMLVDTDFDLVYRPLSAGPAGDEVLIEERESNVGFYANSGVELSDVLREQILLSLPMQRVCREACKGICPVCGQNRNVRDCGCQEEPGDDRWSALRNL
jgi:uncharacterized protein